MSAHTKRRTSTSSWTTLFVVRGSLKDNVSIDHQEFTALTAAHFGRLRLLARRLAPRGLDPEDLLQDTLERGWRSHGELQHPDAAGTWLRTIMVNRVRDHARRASLLTFSPMPDALEPEDLEIEDPLVVIAAAEQENQLRSALRMLPPEEVMALVLVDGEGWQAAEVAAVCDCSSGAIHKRVQRARARLALNLASATSQRSSRPTTASCHDARALASDYLDGRLGAETRTQLEAHLRSCERCPPVLRALRGIVAALGAGRGPLMPADRMTALHAKLAQ